MAKRTFNKWSSEEDIFLIETKLRVGPRNTPKLVRALNKQFGTKRSKGSVYSRLNSIRNQFPECQGDLKEILKKVAPNEEQKNTTYSELENFDKKIYSLFEKRENFIYNILKNQADEILWKDKIKGYRNLSAEELFKLDYKESSKFINLLKESQKRKIKESNSLDIFLIDSSENINLLLPIYFDSLEKSIRNSKNGLQKTLYESTIFSLKSLDYSNFKRKKFRELIKIQANYKENNYIKSDDLGKRISDLISHNQGSNAEIKIIQDKSFFYSFTNH